MSTDNEGQVASESTSPPKPKGRGKRNLLMLLRRIHLYAGLFLLPWVFLYGITGAMYNHVGLFPEMEIKTVDASDLADTAIADFPSPEELAQQVVAQLRQASPDSKIEFNSDHAPEFVNNVILRVDRDGRKRLVQIDPVRKSAWVATGKDPDPPKPLLKGIRNVSVEPNPYELAKKSVPTVLEATDEEPASELKPAGWSKLNFLATVDGKPARVTYVLRDGHVDITEYNGDSGMSARRFFMRLHTTHGRSPHWNGRMLWSIVIDVMAIAMVTWGITGIVMWWQIKRTRVIGLCVIGLSIASAFAAYYSVAHFYATSKL